MSETPTLDNLPILSVSEIGQAIKRTLEGAFERVRVKGEVSQAKYHGSGHLYLRLKDESAVLEAVCWRGTVGRLGLKVEDGMEVIVTGKIGSYPGRSQYQIVIEAIELAGEGALLKLLEERKRKLAAEGLFDAARKKKLPRLPETIGVITSPTGAVIRDILHRLADRFPRHVLLWPVAVQGEGAAEQVAAAIRGFNALEPGGPVPRPDLLIVARGGGSLEDLWAFNEEVVVRAAAASAIPLIAAIGHETDVTLIDFAADLRAPTPSAAAEMAVPVRAELAADLIDYGRRAMLGLGRFLGELRLSLEGFARGLGDPARLVGDKTQTLDGWAERLANARGNYFERRWKAVENLAAGIPTPRQHVARLRLELAHAAERLGAGLRQMLDRQRLRLDGMSRLLDSIAPDSVLRRGFVLVKDAAGALVTAAAAVVPGMALVLKFADGEAAATAAGRAKPPAKAADGNQGSLL